MARPAASEFGVEQSIVRKSGAWYTYEGDQLGQGKENARNFLKDNPDLANEIEKKIKEKLGVGPRLDGDPAGGGSLNVAPDVVPDVVPGDVPGPPSATSLVGAPGGTR